MTIAYTVVAAVMCKGLAREGGQDELGGEGGKSSVSDKGVKAGEGDHSG